jgi:3-hydroxyacyl-CoA dehydrogenase/enoyl-CoA hydratase/3-hydroxybutyryl-CoA epimerase
MTLTHWTMRRDPEGVVWATLDRKGESVNTLSTEVLQELSLLLDHLEAEPPRGLIIRSGKSSGFIAGADIREFGERVTPEQGHGLVERGWSLFRRLSAVSYPTLALIRGFCLGGGLELSLACRHRVVVDQPDTRLGLPEVLLGIVPAWGGMTRLPQRIGPVVALDLMLTGRTLDARKAWRLGLADECVPPRLMERAAQLRVLDSRPSRLPSLGQRLLNGPLRGIVAAQARKKVMRKASPDHYPAPYALIELWQHYGGNALAAPRILDRILESPTTRNLLRVYHLQERLKQFGSGGGFNPERVHVVGAGVMGGDIAAWCALRGLTVTLQDQSLERIQPALMRARALFVRRLKSPQVIRAAWDRLIPDPAGSGAAHADVVIEAIVEDLEAKRSLFVALEKVVRPLAVIATNTSSLPLEEIAAGMQDPSRLVGIHFFNPVAQMPLVEVVHTASTSPDCLQAAAALVRRIDKLPLPVKSAPGFLVNAVLAPYMQTAMLLMDGMGSDHLTGKSGQTPFSSSTLDAAMEAFGMPMGPVELMDTVGLDIVLAAGKRLSPGPVPACLAERVAHGHLGKKSGRGFYEWSGGKPRKPSPGPIPDGLALALVKPLIAATRHLLQEGIVEDADLADAGVIFGTGFAPYTGGPLNSGL